jgi:signal transduction histidine kinase
VRGGLLLRTAIASGLLAVVVVGGFAILVIAVNDLRASARMAARAEVELDAADRLERLVIDLETGARGFVITRQERFLQPWDVARAAFPRQLAALERFEVNRRQASRLQSIGRSVASYIKDYSAPLIKTARLGRASTRSVAATAEGKRLIDAIRAQFDGYRAMQLQLLRMRQGRDDALTRRAFVAATVGLAGSILLIVLFVGYLARALVFPVRQAAGMASRLAGGDLSVRVPETGTGEIGALERAFNTMASSLEASRDELVASRARVLGAADDARRRVVRDLHDGAQQRLVHTIITLKLAQRAAPDAPAKAQELIAQALSQAEQANAELRELAHGLLPAVLARGGLEAGVDALTSRLSVPVTVDVSAPRLAPEIEASAYFVVAEALTNVVKHSGASSAEVRGWVQEGELHVEVRDDGVGGARSDGAGLVGLGDRVAALGGQLRVRSTPGGGTLILATLPLPV